MKSPRKKDMQVSYPVAMTRRITLHHNLTQTHFQRFFQQASARMASIQGLRVNEDTDEEILRIEGMFKEIIAKATETLGASQQHWKERLEGAGFDPDMSSVQGGLEFDAPITTPWSNKYLEVYRRCDDALMLVEMAWIAEELETVIDKRNAVAEVRKPLVETARQIQRAVTQAFQESRQRDEARSKKSRFPEAWGENGRYVAEIAPELVSLLVDAPASDPELFQRMLEGFKDQYAGKKLHAALDAIAEIKLNSATQSSSDDATAADANTDTDTDTEESAESAESDEPAIGAG